MRAAHRASSAAPVLAWPVLAWLVLGCGHAAPPVDPEALRPPDRLTALARRLPPGADRCVLARVGTVAERHRELVGRLGAAGPLAWASGAPLSAYAEGVQRTTDGREASQIALRVADVEATRRWLQQRAPLRVEWGEARSCRDGDTRECWRWRAWAADTHTVMLRRGPWMSELEGVERRCAQLARRHRDALELTARRSGGAFVADALPRPEVTAEALLLPSAAGLRWEERIELPETFSPREAELFLDVASLAGDETLAAASDRRQRIRGDVLETEARFHWDDLALAAEDEARVRRALAEAARDRLHLPVEQVSVSNLEVVLAQLALRREQLAAASSEEARIRAARGLVALLRRARRVHPGNETLARAHFDVLLDPLGEAADAAEVATAMLGAEPVEPASWARRRREALAHVGPEALAEALVRDEVVPAARAEAAAATLVALRGSYESAEGAVVVAEAPPAEARRLRRARGSLPLATLLETLVALLDQGAARNVHAVLRTDAALEPGVRDTSAGRVLGWREGDASVRVAASWTGATDFLRGTQRALFRGLDGGEVDLLVALSPMDGAATEPDGVLRLRGRVEGERLSLTQASSRAFRWDAVGTYVGAPFGELEVRLFPPPDLEAGFESGEDARRARRRAGEEPVLSCRAPEEREEGVTLRCRTSPQLDASRRAWVRVVAPWIARSGRL